MAGVLALLAAQQVPHWRDSRALELDPALGAQAFAQLAGLARHQAARGLDAESRATFRFALDLAEETGHDEDAAALRLEQTLRSLF